jgi:hypothetical protein
MVARAWHAISDEPLVAVQFGGEGCGCRNYAPYALRVLELFYGDPPPEPEGLGAVVVNPLTDKVYVRAAHPALPWHNPEEDAPEQWADPTREDWFLWNDLPRPLVVHSLGWRPPDAPVLSAPPLGVREPTGFGAVVVDAADEVWVRVHGGREPWLKVDQSGTGLAENWEGPLIAEAWTDLTQPVQIRSHGWKPPSVA